MLNKNCWKRCSEDAGNPESLGSGERGRLVLEPTREDLMGGKRGPSNHRALNMLVNVNFILQAIGSHQRV